MNNKKLLGRRIKELRKNLNLTQERLAELIGIETSSLSGIESGRHYPSFPTAEKISEALNTKLKILFDFEHHLSSEEMINCITENLNKLDNEKLAFLYKFVEEFKN